MALFFLIIGILSILISLFLYTKKITPIVFNNKEKGSMFEDFVIQYFCKNKQIKLLSKVSDYYKNGVMAIENIEPDLKFIQNDKKFAVECKWRNAFIDNKITWANEQQILNYNNYSISNNQSVLIAIGIGGKPNLPKKLYLVPLYRLTKTLATEKYIEEFEVNLNKTYKHYPKIK